VNDRDPGLPVEVFIQALTTQLDRAQEAMAVKARNRGLPLTFAVKDISLNLRAHIDFVGSAVRIRPAGPGDTAASVLQLDLTTITEPTIVENTPRTTVAPGTPSIREAFGDDLSEDEERRLEWAGITNVAQLKELERTGTEAVVERVAQLPVERLRRALARAAQPRVRRVLPVAPADDGVPLLRVDGENLVRTRPPVVRIGGRRAAVVDANDTSLLVKPVAAQLGGVLVVETGPDTRAEFSLDVAEPPATGPNGGTP
jgi:hypothetical protein